MSGMWQLDLLCIEFEKDGDHAPHTMFLDRIPRGSENKTIQLYVRKDSSGEEAENKKNSHNAVFFLDISFKTTSLIKSVVIEIICFGRNKTMKYRQNPDLS